MAETPMDFVECPACLRGVGTAKLCSSCLSNRTVIAELKQKLHKQLVEQDPYHVAIQEHGGSKYIRTIREVGNGPETLQIDVYCVIDAYAVTCPARQHALKKLLCAGLRDKSSQLKDLRELMDAMWRAIELQEQREELFCEPEQPKQQEQVVVHWDMQGGRGSSCGASAGLFTTTPEKVTCPTCLMMFGRKQ